MKKILLIAFLMLGIEAIAQTTTIPDAVFEQALIDLEIDSDGVINGQVLTGDVENITMLFLDGWEGLSELTDITGIEDFSSLEMLQVSWTQITELDVSYNTLLRYLDCRGNLLTELDLSSNTLLEELYISNVSDIWPQNEIKEIDLSNNPNIHTFQSIDLAIETINLKNGNNSTPMSININMIPWGAEPGIYNTVCIEVDNPELAQSNLPPYSEWEIEHVQAEFSFTADCSLGNIDRKMAQMCKVYPNPASDVVNITIEEGISLEKIKLYDIAGRLVKEFDSTAQSFSVSDLHKGIYIIKAIAGRAIYSERIIIE